ncbi:lysophospholipase L1-like esterase [Pullulanibacillus pueri]|uniref:Spore germination lipase LipC n=1 Tax=Pullulanibacillus pueri TaxID=1437324 RepID=A0A8J2ZS86_9BACL|nr:GDSL-type esterase/lipase family protein [Pullulanibacillus pueri]MBM7680385.1 lysophospholipase L1-like esterase [Pullulanibacillus pueri]GGH75331.1 spore germination lipase LipC [Pullulanibacillus pueri]
MSFKQPLLYTALGDSLTVGVGADLFSPAFVGRYQCLSEKKLQAPVCVQTFAKNGATSGDILEAARLPAISEALKSSSIITVTAGANDLIHAGEQFLFHQDTSLLLQAMETAILNITELIELIQGLHFESSSFILRLQNLYNPFPQLPEAEEWIRKFNAQMAGLTRHRFTKVADIHGAFAGKQQELLSPHGVHPNDNGYAVMAQTVAQLGYDPLR